ncbi:hypothetical protein [Longimicrobium sp.]|uniref:hypothetical protein n=1 Tax=Longimicrobium sp. TaxID=2029185 RepID=UPI003B3A33E8
MAAKPTGWNRIVAKLQGEVPAAELEAFRRASGPVLELLDQVERRRLECRIDGLDPWTVPPATRAVFLCAWNAFVLQTLGNEFLDADYRMEPRTPHFVPPVTALQVLRFYEPVEGWVNRAWQAQANPDYRLDLSVPAPLPAWEQVEPFPPAHLDGLLNAMRSVRDHADAAVAFLPATPPEDPRRQTQLNRIRQLYASAQARARYAEELAGNDPVAEVRERAGEHARAAVEQLHLLGQLVSDPELADESVGPRAGEREGARGQLAPAPPAPAPGAETAVPRLHLVTRPGLTDGQTIIEAEETIDFAARLPIEMHFSLRLVQVRTAANRMIVLRTTAVSYEAYPMLTAGTLTIQADAQTNVLRALPDRKRARTDQGARMAYVETMGFELHGDLLPRLCSARAAALCFKNYRGPVGLDATTISRLQAYCRGFYDAVARSADPPA